MPASPTALTAEHFGKPNECTAAIIYYRVLLFAGPPYNPIRLDASHSCEPMNLRRSRAGDEPGEVQVTRTKHRFVFDILESA